MGQAVEKERQNHTNVESIDYQVDLHSIEFSLDLPSSFPYTMQIVIQETSHFLNNQQATSLQTFIIFYIDKRFSKFNVIDSAAFHKQKSIYSVISIDDSKFEKKGWKQLQSQQSFFKLLLHIQHQYHQQAIMMELFTKSQTLSQLTREMLSDGTSLRKPFPQLGEQGNKIQENLLKRLFYRYYENVLKNYANSPLREQLLKFHNQIGKMLCCIISKHYFSYAELYELAYCMICLDKEGVQFNNKFQYLRKKYFKFCLEKKYVVDVEQRKRKLLESATRLYLDELYMNCVQEAEDPEIKVAEDDFLNPTKSFPVQRVKEKYKT